MSDRPTPETNEAQFGTGRVSVDFARNLERQRDEARELARELRIHLMNLVDHEPCKCCYDDQAEIDWSEAQCLLTKAKEMLG